MPLTFKIDHCPTCGKDCVICPVCGYRGCYAYYGTVDRRDFPGFERIPPVFTLKMLEEDNSKNKMQCPICPLAREYNTLHRNYKALREREALMGNTSHLTAMVREDLSAPMKWLKKKGMLRGKCLDYGSGRGTDAFLLGMDQYDPFYSPAYPKDKYDTITCNYVLNVVPEIEEEDIIRAMRALLLPDGRIYVTVRRDLPKEGRKGRGCWQRYVELKEEIIRENKSYCIYSLRGK